MRKGGVLAGLLMMEAVVWGQGDGRGAGPESTPNDAVGSATVSGKPVKRGALRALFMAQKLGLDAGAEAVLQRLEQPGQISPHEPAVMSPLPVVRAEVIEWLCKDPKAVEALGADGLEIAHVAVLGRPNLDHVRMTVPFRAIDCTFAEGFSAINAKFSLLELSMVRMGKFTADGLQVEGDIRLCNFQATDEVRFAGAAVGKDLYCVNAHFDCPKRKDEIPRVLNLDGAKFEGSVYFRKGESRAGIPEGCTALGEVNMLRIRTKGEVSCENMSLHQPK
ncbi:MAG TPA: hypothetical protein VK956_08375, partial [Verrucomicrobium sp.]|nr:hypothetical protein [Verrucomicrobium sp.]